MAPEIDTPVLIEDEYALGAFADPGGMPARRGAAGFTGVSGVRADTQWAPSTTTLSFRVKVNVPAAAAGVSRDVFGGQGAGEPLVRIGATEGVLYVWGAVGNTSAVLTGAWQYGSTFVLELRVSPTGLTVLIDGVVVEDLQAVMAPRTATYTFKVADGGGSNPFWGRLWDLELIDPADPTNSAFFPLDQNIGGEFLNTLEGSNVGNATITGDIEFVTVNSSTPATPLLAVAEQGIKRADFSPAAGMPVRRWAAWVGSSGYAEALWAPSTSASVWEVTTTLPKGAVSLRGLLGNAATGKIAIWISGSAVFIRAGLGIAGGGWDFTGREGQQVTFRLEITASTATLLVDGRVVLDAMHSNFLDSNPAVVYLGSIATGLDSAQSAIWDVRLIDPEDPDNCALYHLDARNAAGDYPNALGTSVGDATVSGAVIPVRINATGGSGVPLYSGPIIAGMERTSDRLSSATTTILSASQGFDPHDLYDNNGIVIPYAHSVTLTLTGRMRATALTAGADEVELRFRQEGAGTNYFAHTPLTLSTVDKWVPFMLHTTLDGQPAGAHYKGFMANNDAGNSLEFDDYYFTAIITPSTIAS